MVCSCAKYRQGSTVQLPLPARICPPEVVGHLIDIWKPPVLEWKLCTYSHTHNNNIVVIVLLLDCVTDCTPEAYRCWLLAQGWTAGP